MILIITSKHRCTKSTLPLQEDILQTSYNSPSKYNLYESMQGHGANLMENLQSTLKQREGEIHQLHVCLHL